MTDRGYRPQHGPFRPEQVRSGDPYELSQGHPIYCAPTGRDGTGPNGLGFAVLDSDPAVRNAGVDTGLAIGPGTLRAPDVAVNFEGGDGTWATTAPLALEYAGKGQDEAELRTKIAELLAAGTQWVWVVRLVGPRRVDVHERGVGMRTVGSDGTLTAPGVLGLPVPVRALFDREAAHEVTLRNLLAAKGYPDIDAVRAEGREEGHRDATREAVRITLNFKTRGLPLDAAQSAQLNAETRTDVLDQWFVRALTAARAADVFADRR